MSQLRIADDYHRPVNPKSPLLQGRGQKSVAPLTVFAASPGVADDLLPDKKRCQIALNPKSYYVDSPRHRQAIHSQQHITIVSSYRSRALAVARGLPDKIYGNNTTNFLARIMKETKEAPSSNTVSNATLVPYTVTDELRDSVRASTLQLIKLPNIISEDSSDMLTTKDYFFIRVPEPTEDGYLYLTVEDEPVFLPNSMDALLADVKKAFKHGDLGKQKKGVFTTEDDASRYSSSSDLSSSDYITPSEGQNTSESEIRSKAKPTSFHRRIDLDLAVYGSIRVRSALWVFEPIVDRRRGGDEYLDSLVPYYRFRNHRGHYLIVSDKGELEVKKSATEFCPTESDTWLIRFASVPGLPEWAYRRSHTFHTAIRRLEFMPLYRPLLTQPRSTLTGIPVMQLYIQDNLLVNELLLCFFGVPGHLLRFRWGLDELKLRSGEGPPNVLISPCRLIDSTPKDPIDLFFEIATHIDAGIPCDGSFRQMVEKILSVARIQRKIAVFVENCYDWTAGICSQAMGEIGRTLLINCHNQIIEFESLVKRGKATPSLQCLWFFLQQTYVSLQLLERVVDVAKDRRGGRLLSSLYSLINELPADDSRAILKQWFHKLSVHWTRTLSQWLIKGVLVDPRKECFITCDPLISIYSTGLYSPKSTVTRKEADIHDGRHPFWFRKFGLDTDQIPSFLSLELANKILDGGRFSAALRQCPEANVVELDEYELPLSIVSFEFSEVVERFHETSSNLWWDFVKEKSNLVPMIKSFESFMFGGSSDFHRDLITAITNECQQQTTARVRSRMNFLFRNSLEQSSLRNDRNAKLFICQCSEFTIKDIVRALGIGPTETTESWAFAAKRGLNPQSDEQQALLCSQAEKVQEIFQALALNIEVEWPLTIVWPLLVQVKLQAASRLALQLRVAVRRLEESLFTYMKHMTTPIDLTTTVCSNMLHLLRNLLLYLNEEVFRPFFSQMVEFAQKSINFNEFIRRHEEAIEKMMEKTFLTDRDALRSVLKILAASHLVEDTVFNCAKFKAVSSGEIANKEVSSYNSLLEDYNSLFKKYSSGFLKQLRLRCERADDAAQAAALLLDRLNSPRGVA